jgi:hypothetical protein
MKKFVFVRGLVMALILAMFAFGACNIMEPPGSEEEPPEEEQTAQPEETGKNPQVSSFVPVRNISGIPEGRIVNESINLNELAKIEPDNSTIKTITWTLNEGSIEVEGIATGTVTPAVTGELKVKATIAKGGEGEQDYSKGFTINIINEFQFVAVTDITEVPSTGKGGVVLDLSEAFVSPENATNRSIVWTVTDAGGTGVSGFTDNKASPTAGGTLKLLATITKGGPSEADFTKTFTIEIAPPELPPAGENGNSGGDNSGNGGSNGDNGGNSGGGDSGNGDNGGSGEQPGGSGGGEQPEEPRFIEFGFPDSNITVTPGSDPTRVSLSVVEQPVAYFTVPKKAGETITVSGTDAGYVTQHTSGSVNGSSASETLSVFSVDTGGLFQYFGGSREFTLSLQKDGTAIASTTVTLTGEVENPDSTDCTVFTVTYPNGKETLSKADAFNGTSLNEALQWIDVQTVSGTPDVWQEYLVRLAKDEPIKKTNLHGTSADYVKIRLRAYGGERRISHDGTTDIYGKTGNDNYHYGLLNIGETRNPVASSPYLAFQIEDNVTLDGKNTKFNTGSQLNLKYMIAIFTNSAFIMEEGSRITGFVPAYEGVPLIAFGYDNSAFYMKGGSIDHNTGFSASQYQPLFSTVDSSMETTAALEFHRTGGVFSGNDTVLLNLFAWSAGGSYGVSLPDAYQEFHFYGGRANLPKFK